MEHASRAGPGVLSALAVLLPAIGAGCLPGGNLQEQPSRRLADVRFWAYQIQELDMAGAVDALARSHYDMLVIEPTRSDRENAAFDTAGMVSRLKASTGSRGQSKLVIAYLDIGEAEDWRWYWDLTTWVPPTQTAAGTPSFLVRPDPDGWAGNFPVAFWDPRWKSIMITQANSAMDQILGDGFDGVYMDWVEAYSDEAVEDEAQRQGKNPATEMIQFIREIRQYARGRDPDFLIIAQNAADLLEGRPEYLGVIDAIAQEHVYFMGQADTLWGAPASGDTRIPATGEGHSTEWYTRMLRLYRASGLPVFTCDYALDADNAGEAYQRSAAEGFVPYVSQTPLSQLTETPPPAY